MVDVVIDFERCKECGYCVHFCPKKVLRVGQRVNKKGYYPPVVEHADLCVGCATCAKVCPEAAIAVYR